MILNLKSKTDLSGFYVIFNGSVQNERNGWHGISHLMEHLQCKNIDHLQNEFQQYGISWNAYTSDNEIVFYMTGLNKYVQKYRDIFLEKILEFNVTKEILENEKKIVLEEYDDSFNQQSQQHYLNLMRKLYDHYSPIGLKKDIENVTLQDCEDFYNLQYSKPTMIINVSKTGKYKGFDDFREKVPSKDINFADQKGRKFNKIKGKNFLEKILEKLKRENKTNSIDIELENNFKSKSSILIFSPLIEKDFATVSFITSMLSSGLNSPLYKRIREELGLTYYIGSNNTRFSEKSLFIIYTETSNENVDLLIDEVKKIMLDNKKHLTQERFDIVKESLKISYEKAEINKHANVKKYFTPKDFVFEHIIDEITLEDVHRVFDEHLKWENFYISVDNREEY